MSFPPFTVFDTETTGLDPRKGHKIVEIAGVRVEDGNILEEVNFVALINPEREIPWGAKQIHKIGDDEVHDAPTIDLVLPQFLEFAQGTTLFAHNADFDMGFLECEKDLCWGYIELPECLCTMRLSRSISPEEFRHNLDAVSARLNVQMPVDRHRALPDVLTTAAVLLKLIEKGNIENMDDLRKLAGKRALVK